MLKEILQKDNYDILQFSPFVEYIEQQDSLNPVLISDNNDKNNRKIEFSQDGYEKCVLIMLKDQEKEWLSINKFLKSSDSSTESVEEINFLIYDDNNLFNARRQENRVIRYNSLIQNNCIATIQFSSYAYKDEELKKVRNHSRKVKFEDIKKYRKDWLANIIAHIDSDDIPVIEKIDEEINNPRKQIKKSVI